MLYSATFVTGQKIDFEIYDYYYKNPDLKQQFANTAFNVIILFEKTGDTYTHLETTVDNPEDYLFYKLPTDTLYRTNKILLPSVISFEQRKDDFKNLVTDINNPFKNPILCVLFDKEQ